MTEPRPHMHPSPARTNPPHPSGATQETTAQPRDARRHALVAAVAALVMACVAAPWAAPWAATATAAPVTAAVTAAGVQATSAAAAAATAPPPAAATAAAITTGRVVGRAVDATGAGIPRAHVAVFDTDWNWIREVKARSTGRFTLTGLSPGRYIVQVSDSRPAWRTDRRAPSDARVRVVAGQDSVRTITLRRGGFITGAVTRGTANKKASRAMVRATDAVGRSYTVTADRSGQFALGGLPRGTYRLWGYDAGKKWVGRTVKVSVTTAAHAGHVTIRLRTRAGGVNGYVLEGSALARHTTWVTAVNRSTGQWWVVKVRGGDLSLRGLSPGRYTFVVQATPTHAGASLRPSFRVKAGRTKNTTLRLTRRVPQITDPA
ncbi:MSCRAMM family protein [Nocardioides yefusunii]|uniref:Collagen binding domain-containing protein n=1 Tax=Nocardioides yefusunii TaxID=2500546 RepID=A0ABW1QXF9_9ACTN|nr:carboxypeptidase-like regulatory domain-containing protein [Nocardioides yefusunii]